MKRRKQNKNIQTFWVYLILLVILIISVSAIEFSSGQNIAGEASARAPTVRSANDIKSSTLQIMKLSDAYEKASGSAKEKISIQIGNLASARKKALLDQIDKNPSLLLSVALPDDVRNKLPENAAANIEKHVELEGKLTVLHVDDFDRNKGYDKFQITSGGKTYQLSYLGELAFASGSNVRIKGVAVDNKVAVESGQSLETAESAAIVAVQKKVAVIIYDFEGYNARLPSASDLKKSIFTGADSVNAFYKELSFGKVELVGKYDSTGDIYGKVYISYPPSPCQYEAFSAAAKAKVQEQGVDLSGYDYFILVGDSCWSAALINGPDIWISSTDARRARHEMGHALGLHHAGSFICYENGKEIPVSDYSLCTPISANNFMEYGDLLDIMGVGDGHANNFFKARLNWIPSENTITVPPNSQGIYTIRPQETLSDGTMLLRIPRDSTYTFDLEDRKSYGYDKLGGTAASGMNIRVDRTDMVPATKSAMLKAKSNRWQYIAGETFVDSKYNIQVKVLETTTDYIKVDVSVGTPSCIRSTPTVSISPASQWGAPGQALTYTINVKNNDNTACTASDFSVIPTLPTGFVQTPSTQTINLAPGASSILSISVASSSVTAEGFYTFTETATNSQATTYSASATANYNVGGGADTIPPVVTITSPQNGATVSGSKVTVSASASDASGINKIEIFIDNSLKKTCSAVTACSYGWGLRNVAKGSHTITAKATDASSNLNTATTTITVTK